MVIDFLAGTVVGKFPPKLSSGMERAPGLRLMSGIGGNGVITFVLSFIASFFLSLSYLSLDSGDERLPGGSSAT